MSVSTRRAAYSICCLVLLATMLQAAPGKVPAAKPVDPELGKVLAKFDEAQTKIHSLSAEFHQTTTNPILKHPQTADGRFYLRKPDSVLWEYQSPETMKFAINEGRYTGYIPGRKKAERRDVHRWTEQIFRFFAVGQASSELRKFYDIRLEAPGNSMKGTYLLVLDPVKRRVKKRVEEVRLWVDTTSFLPMKVEYVNKQGAIRELDFRNVQLNPDLSAALFNVSIPSGVTITDGITELGSAAGGPGGTASSN